MNDSIVKELLNIKIDDGFQYHDIAVMTKLYQAFMTSLFSSEEKDVNDNLQIATDLFKQLSNFKDIDIDYLLNKLPSIKEKLLKDALAIYEGDPASQSIGEVFSIYPGFKAISCYRIAHEFYLLGYKELARILSEYAHSETGIDINPGAKIGEYFFIDHGTGIVIGETTVIGDHCKIYQGVTLGALSLKNGRTLVNNKRHPTLLNNVIIYSGASIFGGDTIIGNNVTIGSNAEVKSSVPDNSIITTDVCLRR